MRALLLAALGLICSGALAQAPDFSQPGLAVALNKAGRQRMLSQRIVLSYAQAAKGVAQTLARENLRDAIRRFDEQLAELKAYSTNSEIRQAILEIERQWMPVRTLAQRPATPQAASDLNAAGEQLLRAAERGVAVLERHARTPSGRILSLAGRQRMLSQRIAKNYLLLSWVPGQDEIRHELGVAVEDFQASLAQLHAGSAGNETLQKELAVADAQWGVLRAVVGGDPRTPTDSLAVVEASDALLHRMERIALIYQRLAATR